MKSFQSLQGYLSPYRAKRRLIALRMHLTSLLLSSASPSRAFDKDDDDHAPRFGHVLSSWLENEGYDTTFRANSQAPYLSKTLVSKGALLTQYYGTGHASNDNYIAMISGQSGNPQKPE